MISFSPQWLAMGPMTQLRLVLVTSVTFWFKINMTNNGGIHQPKRTGVHSETQKHAWFCSADIPYTLTFRNGRNKDQRTSYVPTNRFSQCQLSRLILSWFRSEKCVSIVPYFPSSHKPKRCSIVWQWHWHNHNDILTWQCDVMEIIYDDIYALSCK